MRHRLVLLPVLLATLVCAPPALAWTWPQDGPVLQPFVLGGDPYAAGQHRGIDVAGAARRFGSRPDRRDGELRRIRAERRSHGDDPDRGRPRSDAAPPGLAGRGARRNRSTRAPPLGRWRSRATPTIRCRTCRWACVSPPIRRATWIRSRFFRCALRPKVPTAPVEEPVAEPAVEPPADPEAFARRRRRSGRAAGRSERAGGARCSEQYVRFLHQAAARSWRRRPSRSKPLIADRVRSERSTVRFPSNPSPTRSTALDCRRSRRPHRRVAGRPGREHCAELGAEPIAAQTLRDPRRFAGRTCRWLLAGSCSLPRQRPSDGCAGGRLPCRHGFRRGSTSHCAPRRSKEPREHLAGPGLPTDGRPIRTRTRTRPSPPCSAGRGAHAGRRPVVRNAPRDPSLQCLQPSHALRGRLRTPVLHRRQRPLGNDDAAAHPRPQLGRDPARIDVPRRLRARSPGGRARGPGQGRVVRTPGLGAPTGSTVGHHGPPARSPPGSSP